MALLEHEVEIPTGRRDGDGHVRVALFAGDMVALALEGHGERAPTILLTLEQARRLHGALSDLIAMVEECAGQAECPPWDGEERRQRLAG